MINYFETPIFCIKIAIDKTKTKIIRSMKSKLLYLITSLLFMSIFSMQAQKFNINHKYGFRLGLNYSDIDFDDDAIVPGESGDARFGFVAGFFAIYNVSEKISIQPEIQFSAQGEKLSTVEDFSGIRDQVSDDPLKVNILQIPVLFNYTIANKFTFSVGPQLGIGIWEWEREDDYQTVQFSGIAGVGYNFTDNLAINLRGSFGLTNVIDADNRESRIVQGEPREALFVAEGVNHYVQLSLAYSL